MSMWLMYLILKLNAVSILFIALPAIIIFASLITLLLMAISDDYGDMKITIKTWNIVKKVLFWAIILFTVGVCMPTTEQAAIIYFVPKVLNNKQIQQMPNKLVTLANEWMDEQIKDLKK